jgi:hypothetical protein
MRAREPCRAASCSRIERATRSRLRGSALTPTLSERTQPNFVASLSVVDLLIADLAQARAPLSWGFMIGNCMLPELAGSHHAWIECKRFAIDPANGCVRPVLVMPRDASYDQMKLQNIGKHLVAKNGRVRWTNIPHPTFLSKVAPMQQIRRDVHL